ncbi:response regulator transcription factor [Pseudoduganella albidiflava]|uniref:DNA-binding response regulator n=1 Tax=Pseudoduganella albidiflava TaxID=321983 RepID=A0A411X4E8_9BURK|nr:response regulator transcription factor [Pseudoduganella albidiflava]QBI03748.1 response regulator transcription factor [Pseudoduganella albidiflava]GGY61964.1 DNA-binding response regulator [Pseudoduganella albidiflava]
MSSKPPDRHASHVVLIVDDVPENLAVLHDALDEAGFTVLVANNGPAALERARQLVPDIILLDAMMPGMDGFEVCRHLRASMVTRAIPIVFMTGLTEPEHVVAAFDAGGTDYVTKPVRQSEVLARIGAHLQTARLMNQARSALDAFGNAMLAVTPHNGRIVWQTPLARQWMGQYFDAADATPQALTAWLAGDKAAPLTIIRGASRLVFTVADQGSEQWMIVLREESDTARVQALMALLKLTQRESEVLHWVMMGKTNKDIGDILGTSPRTVNKHLEHVFHKLGVETRTAAAALALNRMRAGAPAVETV